MVKKEKFPKPVIIKTKEKILQIAADSGIQKDLFLELCKKANCNGSFKTENWEKYLQVIRNHQILYPKPAPEQHCAICGELMTMDKDLRGLFRDSPMTGMRCSNRHHFFMLLEADRIRLTKGISFEDAVEIVKKFDETHILTYVKVPYDIITMEVIHD
jgi:hypothetical protein